MVYELYLNKLLIKKLNSIFPASSMARPSVATDSASKILFPSQVRHDLFNSLPACVVCPLLPPNCLPTAQSPTQENTQLSLELAVTERQDASSTSGLLLM